MAAVHGGLHGRRDRRPAAPWSRIAYRVARAADAARETAGELLDLATDAGQALGYAVRTFGCPAGVRGLALEGAWLAAHLALYPVGLAQETLRPRSVYRTDDLPPAQRSLVCADIEAAGTPILLIHGIMDNRSVFTVFRRALHRRGFGVVHAVNYSLLTDDLRVAAQELHGHVERLRELTGAERVHIVGHSLGGLIARYYVQRLGGSDVVDTLVTLGSPHRGTTLAHLLPTPLARQLRPGSDVMSELAEPAPDCRTRFLVVWSRMDEMIVPQRNARLSRPDLEIEEFELRDVGHLSLPVDARAVHRVVTRLALGRSGHHSFGERGRRNPGKEDTVRERSFPAS